MVGYEKSELLANPPDDSFSHLSPEIPGNVIPKRARANDPKAARRAKLTCPASRLYALEHHSVAYDSNFPDVLEIRLVALEIPGAVHRLDYFFYLLFVLLCNDHKFSVWPVLN